MRDDLGPYHSECFEGALPNITLRLWGVSRLILLTWIPLLLLSILSGHAFAGLVDVPLLHDPAVFGRYLFVLPLLQQGESMVIIFLTIQIRHFIESGIVPEAERSRFESLRSNLLRPRASTLNTVVVVALSYFISWALSVAGLGSPHSTWELQHSTITPAGWWYILVSKPIFFFFLIRGVWIFVLWSYFLFRVSSLDLQLTPIHPDRAGGLGFLGWGLASFSTLLMAVSAVFSSGFAYEILHRSQSLNSLKYHMAVFIVIAMAVLHAPLLSFSGRLSRRRFQGLFDYSTLVLRYGIEFDKKWIQTPTIEHRTRRLRSRDVPLLEDIGTASDHVDDAKLLIHDANIIKRDEAIAAAYNQVNNMRLLPFDKQTFVLLVVAVLLPMIPLLGTTIPLKDIMMKLGELLF